MSSSQKHSTKKNKSSQKQVSWTKKYLTKKYIQSHWQTLLIIGVFFFIILTIIGFSLSTNTQLSTNLRASFRETYPVLGEQEYEGRQMPVTCRDTSSCYCVPSEDDDGTCRNLFGCTDCGVSGEVCSVQTGSCIVPKSKDDVTPIVQGWEKGKPVTCIGAASFFCLNPDEETGECESLGRNEDCAERGGLCRNGVCQHVAHTAQGTQEVRGQEQPVVCVNDNTISCVCTGAAAVGDPCTETTLCQPCQSGCDAATGQCSGGETAERQEEEEPTDDTGEEENEVVEGDIDQEESETDIEPAAENEITNDPTKTGEDLSEQGEQGGPVEAPPEVPENGVQDCMEAVTETSCPGGRVYMGSYCDEETYLCHRACECRTEDGSLKAGCREDEIGTDNYYPETEVACTVE